MIVASMRLARRELRGGLKGFRILVACLALGVAAIAASGSLKAAFHRALAEDGRALLGGDVELRQSYVPITAEQKAFLQHYGTVSETADMRAMAKVGEARRLVELKGVDDGYPLAGILLTQPPLPLAEILDQRNGSWGGAADPHLLESLGVGLGEHIQIGAITVEIRATITAEPDRVANALAFGPRLLVSTQAVAASGLVQPGSLIRWGARLALAAGADTAEVKSQLAAAFPDAPWNWRDLTDAAPGLDRILDNLAAFLTLVGLTALLVGGIGIANAVKAYLDGKLSHIAILKSLGAPGRQIGLIYGLLIGSLSALGIGLGLLLGAVAPWAVVTLAGESLPLAARIALYPQPLMAAAAFGVLTALSFALWPLAQATRVPPTTLFRQAIEPLPGHPGWPVLVTLTSSALALAALAILTADRRELAAIFVAAAIFLLGLYRLLAAGLSRLAALAARRRRGLMARPAARVALANLHRPGSAVVSMVLSLGLGLTVLVTIALIEGNLARQFGETLPAQAPSFYFIDLQPDQSAQFDRLVHAAAAQATIEKAPMVRGRITHLHGQPIDAVTVSPEAQWAVRGDRGLTAAATPPPHTKLESGTWWPADYVGPPLVSIDAGLAKGMGLRVGDSMAINILGREITLTIASLRQVEWTSLNMNFALILSPNALAGAPFIHIATVHAPEADETRVERAVTDALPNVSAIRVKEALQQVRAMIANADLAVRLAGLVTVAAGALVLAGAVMAGHRRRVREAVILKVLGATRAELWRAWLLEFSIIGASTGLCAALFGSLASWAILVHVMRGDWVFLPGLTLAILGICITAALTAGFAGAFVALRRPVAPALRQE
ncbi:ABC transporter permease [Magnetospirillum sulfuroxidans]|uniref:FtsX-like permease family protein n=1 Tax=Magnetospirillum sulfuroxidans TaxID=611300 RepID=A0ABS5IDS3_9PROT|nr:FtsX-like permease family protein [Magnetospirillum sulfuroxidans]MBR9972568.1 FtsX-like permease family protein [Magnetospirillum sulfuroxidans]